MSCPAYHPSHEGSLLEHPPGHVRISWQSAYILGIPLLGRLLRYSAALCPELRFVVISAQLWMFLHAVCSNKLIELCRVTLRRLARRQECGGSARPACQCGESNS